MNTNEIIAYEKKLYFSSKTEWIKERIFLSNKYFIWSYVKCLRKEEHYRAMNGKNILYSVLLTFYRRRKHVLGRKLCFDIPGGVFGPGLLIWHPGPITVNPFARVGRDAVVVGNLCIGNKGGARVAPQIGDNCTFGWGSALIGDIRIGDGCRVGAKALVNKSFEEDCAVLAGIPAENIAHMRKISG